MWASMLAPYSTSNQNLINNGANNVNEKSTNNNDYDRSNPHPDPKSVNDSHETDYAALALCLLSAQCAKVIHNHDSKQQGDTFSPFSPNKPIELGNPNSKPNLNPNFIPYTIDNPIPNPNPNLNTIPNSYPYSNTIRCKN
jgi:hypothetical protein